MELAHLDLDGSGNGLLCRRLSGNVLAASAAQGLAHVAAAQGQQHHSRQQHQAQSAEADHQTSVAAALTGFHRLMAQGTDFGTFLIGLRFGVQDDLIVLSLLLRIGHSRPFLGNLRSRGSRGSLAVLRDIQAVGVLLTLIGIGIAGHQSLHELIGASGFMLSH